MSAHHRFILCIVLATLFFGCGDGKKDSGQQTEQQQAPPEKQVVQPPVELTDYYFGIIRKGAAWTAEETEAVAELQRQHLERIGRLADSGVLVLAGPIEATTGAEDLRGLFVYRVSSMAEARALADSDPSVRAGRLLVDIFHWRGPARMIYDEKYTMVDYHLAFYFQGPFYYAEETPSFWEMVQTQTERQPGICDSCRIVLAGEFPDEKNSYKLAGLIIYEAPRADVLNGIMTTSAAVRSSVYSVRLMKWYGPSGLHAE